MELYFGERREDGLEQATLNGYKYSAKLVTCYFGDKPIGELTTNDLKAFNRHTIRCDLSGTPSVTRGSSPRTSTSPKQCGHWLQLSEIRSEWTFDLHDCAG